MAGTARRCQRSGPSLCLTRMQPWRMRYGPDLRCRQRSCDTDSTTLQEYLARCCPTSPCVLWSWYQDRKLARNRQAVTRRLSPQLSSVGRKFPQFPARALTRTRISHPEVIDGVNHTEPYNCLRRAVHEMTDNASLTTWFVPMFRRESGPLSGTCDP